ncbi:hypothetical protein QIS99_30340 [Streptomyces sp. B-S-A8]|uniref:Uncharacterized protein n=1 Tax=Streptomyces solicavernae TaxID=3043614 RepID=A0ABT6S1A8_9ACTN|nr:hypothetical protein [Streptomyces sp. B-S-A8]MDI3390460.1 hypothetical protein [Streptomyces sp. B-S-A8]
MNAYERLMAESLPTGTFGHAVSQSPRFAEQATGWTPAEQAAHVAALESELDRLEARGPQPQLRLIKPNAA